MDNTKIKKRFGQNFITDTNILKKIISLSQIENENVLEVGPGRGALTQFIVGEAKKVLCYEIDTDLKEYLQPLEDEASNIKIIYDDFLNSKNQDEINNYFNNESVVLLSNLPYYITTPILFNFLTNNIYKTCVLMMQKEVANRILAAPKCKEYGSLSVNIQSFCKVKKLLNVGRQNFYPIPDVDSTLISIEKVNPVDQEFISFTRSIFENKRKTLYNNLVNNLLLSKEVSINLIQELEINPQARSEELDIVTIQRLYLKWKEKQSTP
jgi:16S rRNA (adenine1518-N6/adenine1519-N6)-dimethyltransferase